jgi:hypothetical protein
MIKLRGLKQTADNVIPFHRPVRRLLRRSGLDILPSRKYFLPRFYRPRLQGLVAQEGADRFVVDTDRATTYAGFSYARDGWHPHVETIRAYKREPALQYEQSPLYALHQQFRPFTLQELLLEDTTVPMDPLTRLPVIRPLVRDIWALDRSTILACTQNLFEPTGGQYYGPVPRERGRKIFDRLLSVFRSLQDKENPASSASRMEGFFLAEGDSYRFVVTRGNLRLAAYRVLGIETFEACLSLDHPAVVHREDLQLWTTAHGGILTAATATALFEKMFTETGRSKARHLKLLSEQGDSIPSEAHLMSRA